MEILFIVDKVEDIDRKISMLDVFGADIKFFVHSSCVAKIFNNKFVIDRTVSVYNNNINDTIDKYLKEENYKPTHTLICYASVKLTNDIINQVRDNIVLGPSTIYVKKKFGFWSKVKLWFYQKVIKFIFGFNDEFASVKFQYISQEMMSLLAQTNFKNHIFNLPNSISVELDKNEGTTYYQKQKFNKNNLYNPIVICLILICYVVMERFLVLPFWVYLLIITMILSVIINWFVMIVKNSFDIRFKK